MAHGISVLHEGTKDETSNKIIDHVTKGKCVDNMNLAPGCECLAKDPTVVRENAVYLQIAVLHGVTKIASKKQLCDILDLHEIEYHPGETIKKLGDCLRKYI